jgi:hypothetical protein
MKDHFRPFQRTACCLPVAAFPTAQQSDADMQEMPLNETSGGRANGVHLAPLKCSITEVGGFPLADPTPQQFRADTHATPSRMALSGTWLAEPRSVPMPDLAASNPGSVRRRILFDVCTARSDLPA